MAESDRRVLITFDADAAQAQKELERVQKSIQRIEEKIQKLNAMRTPLAKQAGELAAKLDAANAKLYEMQTATNRSFSTAQIEEQKENVKALQAEYNKVQTRVETYDRQLANANYDLDAAKEKAGGFAAQMTSGGGMDRLSATAQNLAGKFKEISKHALKAGAAVAKGLGKSAVTVLKKTASLAVKAGKGFLNLFKVQGKTNGAFGGGLKSLLKYGLGIRSLYALFNKLRSAITDGFKNLAQFSGETNAAISSVKSALSQLKNTMATAFAPILTTVAPILTKFINMLSTAADYVARLMAALSGKSSYSRAVKVQEDYAQSLSGTGKAAEEASKSLAGFDEITQLTAKDKESSGGGGETSAQDAFETVEIEPLNFDSWGEAFSTMLDKIVTQGVPKLERALTSAAMRINSFSANLAEMLTFPGVHDKVIMLGTEIANAFNDFVQKIDWGTIGTALGAGLNLALGFVVSLIYTFDWSNFGGSLATLVNNAVAEIDWANVGSLLWSGFKIAIETLTGFLLNLDMAQVAQSASEVITGFFNSMTETIDSIDWVELGNQITTFIVNVDWAGITDSMLTAIGALFDALAALIEGLIGSAWSRFMKWLKSKSPVIADFFDGIGKTVSELFASIKKIFHGIIDFIAGVFTGDWERAWGGIKDVFSGVWNGIVSLLEGAVNLVIKGVNWLISKLNTISFDLPDWIPAVGGKSFGINIPPISEVQLPRLASGAVIPPNREFMAVLGDQKSGNNIEAPEALIRKIVREETGGSSKLESLLQTLIDITREGKTMELDGVTFAKVTNRALNNNSRTYGVPVRG